MPTVTVKGFVSPHDAAEALRGQLGSQYEIATHGTGDQEMLTIKQSATATATVRLGQEGTATTFHVHGGGLIVSRLVNELGLAKKVATAIKEAFETVPPAEGKPSLWEAGDRVIEIGCGTGQATVPLAQRGLGVTAIELGPERGEQRARRARARRCAYRFLPRLGLTAG
jgi:2-polyprenyl-3-methyl-5-hydroxy-6-metoxy-1,4-benzoquinol methylase